MSTAPLPSTEDTSAIHVVPKAPLFAIDARTIAMAVLFLIGGGATGAGTSLLGGNAVSEDIKALVSEVGELRRSVDRLVSADADVRRDVDDHEQRIRVLEKKP